MNMSELRALDRQERNHGLPLCARRRYGKALYARHAAVGTLRGRRDGAKGAGSRWERFW